MGTTHQPELLIRLKKNVQLQSSTMLATNAQEFEEFAYKFKAGTLFQNKSHKSNPNEDEDCIENEGMHGWCYSEQPMVWNYCNFHAYILDYWPQFPELFERVED